MIIIYGDFELTARLLRHFQIITRIGKNIKVINIPKIHAALGSNYVPPSYVVLYLAIVNVQSVSGLIFEISNNYFIFKFN